MKSDTVLKLWKHYYRQLLLS